MRTGCANAVKRLYTRDNPDFSERERAVAVARVNAPLFLLRREESAQNPRIWGGETEKVCVRLGIVNLPNT